MVARAQLRAAARDEADAAVAAEAAASEIAELQSSLAVLHRAKAKMSARSALADVLTLAVQQWFEPEKGAAPCTSLPAGALVRFRRHPSSIPCSSHAGLRSPRHALRPNP